MRSKRERLKRQVKKTREVFPKQDALFRRRVTLERLAENARHGKTLSEETRNHLSKLLYGGTVEQVIALSHLSQLGKGDARKAMPVFAAALTAYNKKVRRKTAEALGNIGEKKAQPLLLRALHDKESEVVITAIIALARAGNKKAVPALIKLYEKGKNRHLLVGTLASLRDKQAVPTIIHFLREGRIISTVDVPLLIDSVMAFSPEKIKPILFRLIAHPNQHIRMGAADLLREQAFELAKGKPGLEKKLLLAKEKLKGISEDRKGLLLYAIAINKIQQSQIPVDWKTADRTKRQYVLSLKRQAKESSLDKILEVFGLRKPKKKKGKK